MSKIIIVTDSNSGISKEEAEKIGVVVIPMPFFIEGKTYYEEISLSQDQFYQMLVAGKNISTSQPSIGKICALWDELLKEYDEIVQIPMSSGLSMTCDTATTFSQEKEYLGKVHIVNNMRISVTQRQSVYDALKLIKEGKSGEEIKEILENDALNSSIYITVQDLKYLKRGGRITPAAAAIGSLIGIKPVLQIQGKKLDAFKKCRGMKAGKLMMISAAKNDIKNRLGDDNSKIHVAVAHSNNEEEAKIFLEEIKKEIPNAKDYYIDHLSLSVSCHIGPGSLAIALCKDLEK